VHFEHLERGDGGLGRCRLSSLSFWTCKFFWTKSLYAPFVLLNRKARCVYHTEAWAASVSELSCIQAVSRSCIQLHPVSCIQLPRSCIHTSPPHLCTMHAAPAGLPCHLSMQSPSQQQVTSMQAQRGCAWVYVRSRGADMATTRRQLAPGEPTKQGAGIATTCSAGIATKQGPCIQLCIQLCPCIPVSKSLDVAHGSGLYPLYPLDVAPLCEHSG
jgi:hypothetical protein